MSDSRKNIGWAATGRRAGTAALLLALLAHAFFVSTTHLHRAQRGGAGAAPVSASVGRDERAGGLPTAGAHAQCLLCRLQRNLALGLRHSAPSLNPPGPGPAHVEFRHEPFVSLTHLSLARGRAPPAA